MPKYTMADSDITHVAPQANTPKYTMADSDITHVADTPPPPPPTPAEESPLSTAINKGVTAGRSFIEGAVPFGASEPVFSGINALTSYPDELINTGHISDRSLSQRYNDDVQRRVDLKQKYPVEDIGANLVGNIASPVNEAFTLANGATKALSKGSSALEALLGAGSTAAIGGGLEAGRQKVLGDTGFLKEEEKPDLGTAYALSAVLGAAPPIIKKGVDVAPSALKKSLAIAFNVPEETQNYYLNNFDRIKENASKDVPQAIDNAIGKVKGLLADKVISVDQAKEAVLDLKEKYLDHVRTTKDSILNEKEAYSRAEGSAYNQLRNAKDDASKWGSTLRDSQSAYSEKAKELHDELKDRGVPSDLASKVVDAFSTLKEKVIQGSKEGYAILEKHENNPDSRIPTGHLIQDITNIADKYAITPKFTSPEAQAAAGGEKVYVASDKVVQKAAADMVNDLSRLGDYITPKDAKKLLQTLDRTTDHLEAMPGGWLDPASSVLNEFRGQLNRYVGEIVPEYKAHMVPVAENTKILNEARKSFSNPINIPSKLANIGNDTNAPIREQLFSVGNKTGNDFKRDLFDYLDAKNTLKDRKKVRALKEGLPEYDAFQTAKSFKDVAENRVGEFQSKYDDIAKSAPDEFDLKRRVDEAANRSPQKLEYERGKVSKDSALKDLRSSNKELTPLIDKNGEQVIDQFRRKHSNVEDKLTQLNKYGDSDSDLLTAAKDYSVNDSFNNKFTNGSRNVQLWRTLIPAAIGGLVGHEGVLAGAGAGAAIGATADIYGPKIAQGLLDTSVGVQRKFADHADQIKPVADALKRGYSASNLAYGEVSQSQKRDELYDELDRKKNNPAIKNYVPQEQAKNIYLQQEQGR